MADKKAPRHKRLYKESPTLERGEDGNMAVSKKQDKRGEEPKPGADGEPAAEPHEEARIQEIKDMHTRHETEMKAIHKRHEKEDTKKYDNPKGDSNEKPGAGKKEIKEVTESKENTE